MGKTSSPLPVKLIVGLIARDEALFAKALKALMKKFGPADLLGPIYDFDLTDYYEKEMGRGLKRRFISFERLVPAEHLAKIKIHTNAWEKKLSGARGLRDINIDPGYISLSKLVLATTKSFVHRIYIGRGIFEEITLYFKDGSFTAGPWTYPDFRKETHIALFNKIRKTYYGQLETIYGLSQLYRCV